MINDPKNLRVHAARSGNNRDEVKQTKALSQIAYFCQYTAAHFCAVRLLALVYQTSGEAGADFRCKNHVTPESA